MLKLKFIVNSDPNANFKFDGDGGSFLPRHVLKAGLQTNDSIRKIAKACTDYANLDLFNIVDKKVTGSIVGSMFIEKFSLVAKKYLGPNPSSTGHPDLVPTKHLKDINEDVNWDQFPHGGVEVKTSCGNLPSGVTKRLTNREARIKYLQNVVWKGHHTQINNLLGLYWDYYASFPTIMAVFYSNELESSDFTSTVPKPEGGHTTSVCITKASARDKMAKNWVFCVDLPEYIDFFKKRFKIKTKSNNHQTRLSA